MRRVQTDTVVARRVTRATLPWQRATGYLLRRAVAVDECLWIDGCASVHTLGMRARIDIVFIDGERRIVRVIPDAQRNRVFVGGSTAASTIEFGAGAVALHALQLGDRLALE